MSDSDGGSREEVTAAYVRYRRLTVRAWITVALGLVLAVVFRTPAAWDPAEMATAARIGGWGLVAIGLVLVMRWSANMAEVVGFSRGRYGSHPRSSTTSEE